MIKQIKEANENIQPNTKALQVLKENFPSCFCADGSFDIYKFKEFLSDKTNVKKEGYGLNFLGKNYGRLLASVDTTCVVEPDIEHNKKPENKDSENIYISGDNLDGLKILLKSYENKIKCIYIDPPYNTGSDGFVYNDKFNFTEEELSRKLSIDEEEAKRILDLTSRGSASHSAWLMFMYPRLLLARDLLTDDGVIFISIDDNEQANLKLLCDDVFGEENFEGHIHWRRRSNQPNDKTKLIGLVAEHILVYSKNCAFLKEKGVGKIALTGNFSNPDNDERGPWASKPWKAGSDQSGTRYTIITPKGKELNEEWMGDENTYKSLLADNRIIFPKKGDGMPRKKYFKSEREEEGQCACNWWEHEIYGNNQEASSELEALFGFKNAFSNPKPTKLIDAIIGLSNVKENDTVLDFFSGSATTSEAVLKYSLSNKCNFIAIQLQEDVDCLLSKANSSEKEKWGKVVEMLDKQNRPHTLDQIGIERIIRASKKIREENPLVQADLGFKHYVLKEPNQDTLDKLEEFNPEVLFEDNDILEEFGTDTVLSTWLNQDGYGLTSKAERLNFNGYTAYYLKDHLYLIEKGITSEAIKAIIEKLENDSNFNPNNIVVFGYSFGWKMLEELKINTSNLRNTEKKVNIDIRY